MRTILVVVRAISILCVIYTSLAIVLIGGISSWANRPASFLASLVPFVCIAVIFCLYKFRKSARILSYIVSGYVLFVITTLLRQSGINANAGRYESYQPTAFTEFFSLSGLTGRIYTDLIVIIGIFALLIYLTHRMLSDKYQS